MRIAIGKKSDTGLRFEVDIPGLIPFEIDLEKSNLQSDRAPDWNAVYKGQRCGAFWKKIPKGGGEAFLSGHLESPIFPGGRLEVAIFVAKESGSQKDMVWSPRREETRAESPSEPSPSRQTQQSAPPAYDPGDDDILF